MQTLEATDDFVVTWPNPGLNAAPWVGDRMHFPGPLPHLAQKIVGDFMEQILSAPTLFVNGYQFSFPPTIPESPPEVFAGGTRVWHEDYSRRIRAFCEGVRATDFEAMSLAEATDVLERMVPEGLAAFRLTMIVINALMNPTYDLLDFLERELGADGPLVSATLLQGTRNESATSGTALTNLVSMAAKSPAISQAVKAANLDGVAAAPGGAEFLAEFERFLDEYGWRAETWGTMHRPTWAENPAGLLGVIARYLDDPEGGPAAATERSKAQRTAIMKEVESRLSGEHLAEMRELVERTEIHVPVSEDRARWQLSIVGTLRLPVLAVGRKLVAEGLLEQPDDLFYLNWDEALRAGREPGPWVGEAARKGRAEFERWEKLAPPPFLGTMPDISMIPKDGLRMMRHFAGIAAPSVQGRTIQGTAASRGTVTGRARIIRTLDEQDKLEPGDVLVCITTAPPWTALFAIAGAVVTNTGGVMSHSGICAREFAIPCVVGTQVGTNVIPDGAMITVDGTAGTVTILGG